MARPLVIADIARQLKVEVHAVARFLSDSTWRGPPMREMRASSGDGAGRAKAAAAREKNSALEKSIAGLATK